MTLTDFLLSLLASAITGVALWAALPRGAVLTRTRTEPYTWTVKNDSAVPIELISVTWVGVDTMMGTEMLTKTAPIDPPEDAPLRLVPDDAQDYYRLTLTRKRWKGFDVRPGDILTAKVLTNRTLTIKYRRAGRTGLLERRELAIHGGA